MAEKLELTGMVANPACCEQLKRNNYFSLSPLAPDILVSRDEFGHPVQH